MSRPARHLVPVAASTDVAAAVLGRVVETLDDLVPRMGQAYRDEIPEYAQMPEELMDREVLVTSRRIVEEFFARVVSGGDIRSMDVRPAVTGAGRRRLQMGIPLEAGLHAFRIAGREVWQAVVDATLPGEEGALATLAAHWIEYVDRASTAFAEGYLDASREQLRRLDTRRRAIVDALVAAKTPADAASVASEFSLVLASAYTPVLVDGEDVATRIDGLLAAAPKDTLAGFRGHRVLLLVPQRASAVMLKALVRRSPVLIAHADAAPVGDGLPDRVRHAAQLLDAAQLSGRTTGVVGPSDLLLEQFVASNEPAARIVRERVLEPLGDHDPDGVFRSTLRTYLACGSIPETARIEVCHPNTVAYRLKRVAEITGLDARVPQDAAVLAVATIVERSQP